MTNTDTKWYHHGDPGAPSDLVCSLCDLTVGPWEDECIAGVNEYWESDTGRLLCDSCWTKVTR